MSKIVKRLMDIFGALFGFIIFLPAFLIIMIVVKSDGGNIFFGHKRVGYKNKEFICWKFRTMIPDSENFLKNHFKKNRSAKKEWEENFKLENDPRITKIGRFLRRTSLDEIPQFWNVLKGDMSLVGPRPIVKEEERHYGDKINLYYSVKPGLTGLWQVSGRSGISYDERVKLDVKYIKNHSIFGDILIILKTVKVVFLCHGAK